MSTLNLPNLLADVFNRELQAYDETAVTADVLANTASRIADALVVTGTISDRGAWCDLASWSGLEIPASNYGPGSQS